VSAAAEAPASGPACDIDPFSDEFLAGQFPP
jgi:hypothetical protein